MANELQILSLGKNIPSIDEIMEELAQRIVNKLAESLSINSPAAPQKQEKYLTRQQTADFLNIALPTLHRHTKSQKIPSYRIGGRVLYKQSELETSLSKYKN